MDTGFGNSVSCVNIAFRYQIYGTNRRWHMSAKKKPLETTRQYCNVKVQDKFWYSSIDDHHYCINGVVHRYRGQPRAHRWLRLGLKLKSCSQRIAQSGTALCELNGVVFRGHVFYDAKMFKSGVQNDPEVIETRAGGDWTIGW